MQLKNMIYSSHLIYYDFVSLYHFNKQACCECKCVCATEEDKVCMSACMSVHLAHQVCQSCSVIVA